MPAVEFFFDLSCPWTYLATGRLREAAMRTGADITWRPFLLADVNPQLAASRWPQESRRATHARDQLAAWAHYCDLELRLSPDWPVDVSLAARGAAYAAETGHAAGYVQGVFAAGFAAGADIRDANLLCRIAEEAGVPAAGFRDALKDSAIAAIVAGNGADLLNRGGFESATMFVAGRMYCGNESMPLVEFALGQASDRQFVMPGQHA